MFLCDSFACLSSLVCYLCLVIVGKLLIVNFRVVVDLISSVKQQKGLTGGGGQWRNGEFDK